MFPRQFLLTRYTSRNILSMGFFGVILQKEKQQQQKNTPHILGKNALSKDKSDSL